MNKSTTNGTANSTSNQQHLIDNKHLIIDTSIVSQPINNIYSNTNSSVYNNINISNNTSNNLSEEPTNNIIYVTSNSEHDKLRDLLVLTGDTEQHSVDFINNEYAQLSLLFPNVNSILIPKKVEYNLKKYVSKSLLRDIHPDINIAIEKCLVFLSNLASTYYTDNKWKSLHSTKLHEQLKNGNDNTYYYKKVIKALTVGTKKDGSIINIKKSKDDIESYEIGIQTKQYKLTNTYLKAGLTEYIIKDDGIIQNRNKIFYKALVEANENSIVSNLFKLYPSIDLPSKEEILKEGKRLAKSGYTTKSGKKLTIRNKHKDSYWNDAKKRSFVEDNIELFSFLTKRGYMIPVAGKHTSGGRVVDSFNLMPSWIRKMVKVNGENIVESDYSAMHPNLAMTIYNGSSKHINHRNVAGYLDIHINKAKKENLSFFNKPYSPSKKTAEKGSMKASPLFDYYLENEPAMLNKIKEDKINNGYKSTTYKLFRLEVEVMTEVIKRLNNADVYVMYVYDALYCSKGDYKLVSSTMNQVVKEMNINTMVK